MKSDPDHVGDILKQTREAKGVSLEKISDRSNISLRYLQAIEHNQLNLLPNDVFARSFIRQYAQLVGLDGEEIVELYRRQNSNFEVDKTKKEKIRFNVFFGIVFLLLLIAVSWILWNRLHTESSSPPTTGETEVSTKRSSDPPVRPLSPVEAVIAFKKECWISVMLDNKEVFEGVKTQNEQLKYAVRKQLSFRAGDAGALEVTLNGKPYNIDGRAGEPVDVMITIEESDNE